MKKSILSRLAALALSLVLLLSLAACGDVSYVAKSGDITITPGIYLFNLLRSMTRAATQLESPPEDIWSAQIDGMALEDWVVADTQKAIAQYVAIENLAKDKNVTLSEETEPGDQQHGFPSPAVLPLL